ncbi:MAG: hypothetical protein IJX67_10900 [Oscillospiraceae bacterium]|nr:hypothetical protein [Oscillospiraceae bacterium]
MADCKACGAFFGTAMPQDLCPTCDRALKRLNGYVAPVVHGEWRAKIMKDIGTHTVYWCSKCNCCSYFRYKYCPNCGAKMDLEVQDA